MRNIQISFDEELLKTIDRFAMTAQLSRSALVREAVKNWIRQKKAKEFEDEWIAKLIENPPDATESEAWQNAESWSDP